MLICHHKSSFDMSMVVLFPPSLSANSETCFWKLFDNIARINIGWDIYIVHILQEVGRYTSDQASARWSSYRTEFPHEFPHS